MQDIPKLLAKSPQTAKAKLAQHISQVRLILQQNGSHVAEKIRLLKKRIAGSGFEHQTSFRMLMSRQPGIFSFPDLCPTAFLGMMAESIISAISCEFMEPFFRKR